MAEGRRISRATVHRLVVGGLVLVLAAAGASLVRGLLPLDPASLGCDPDAVGTGPGAPVGTFRDAGGFAPGAAWVDDIVLEEGSLKGVLNDVAATGSIAVAVGRRDLGLGVWRPLIVASSDGVEWRASAIAQAEATDGGIEAVTVGGPGWVAVGSISTDDRGGSAGGVWTSADGLTWQRQALQPVANIHRVAAGDSGLLALASVADGTATLGRSRDGADWTWSDPGVGSGGFSDIAWATSEWIAVGFLSAGGDDILPAVWRSPDGLAWTCRPLPVPEDYPRGHATRVLPGATTTLITGFVAPPCPGWASCPASAASWILSGDGSWTRLDPNATRRGPTTVAPDGSFVSVDTEGVWRSRDAASWQRIAGPPTGGWPEAIAVTSEGLIGVGAMDGVVTRPWIGILPATP